MRRTAFRLFAVVVLGTASLCCHVGIAAAFVPLIKMAKLDPAGFGITGAIAMNKNGTVVGSCPDAAGLSRPVSWTQGVPADLDPLHIGGAGQALCVNGAGLSAGVADNVGFLYANPVVPLTGLGRANWPADINDAGQIVGSSRTDEDSPESTLPFLSDGADSIRLLALPPGRTDRKSTRLNSSHG